MTCQAHPSVATLEQRSHIDAELRRSPRHPVRCLGCRVTFIDADAWARHFHPSWRP